MKFILSTLASMGIVSCISAETFTYQPHQIQAYGQHHFPVNPHGTRWLPQNQWRGPTSASNPNKLHPWVGPAGTQDMDRKRLGMIRRVALPGSEKIQVWKETRATEFRGRGIVQHEHVRWRFPKGTTITEELYYDNKKFAVRSRHKTSDDPSVAWDPDEKVIFRPAGFREESRDCIECHKEAGRRADELPEHFPGREWYGYLRGDDQVFSFRPIDPETGEIREDLKPYCEWVERGPQDAN